MAAKKKSAPKKKASAPDIAPEFMRGQHVIWGRRHGNILRRTGNGHYAVLVGNRTYEVPAAELRDR